MIKVDSDMKEWITKISNWIRKLEKYRFLYFIYTLN
jgi:hypothetical protein